MFKISESFTPELGTPKMNIINLGKKWLLLYLRKMKSVIRSFFYFNIWK